MGAILYLPTNLTEKQINYLERSIPYFHKLEKNNKVFNVGIYSSSPVYYNNKKYRNLEVENEVAKLNGSCSKTRTISELLQEELNKQKEMQHKINF